MTKPSTKVYISLGSNIGDSEAYLRQALHFLGTRVGITHVKASSFYKTSPVSSIPQNDFINAVCQLETSLSARELLEYTQSIEKQLAKVVKEKDGPRTIDLDILFFGTESINEKDLIIPHPRWNERLFVLIPLLDLTDTIGPFNLKEILSSFNNFNHQVVTKL